MAYYLTVEKKRGEYLPLTISNSKLFLLSPKFNKPGAHTLEEIDEFTMLFNDEQELRETLIQEQILPKELSTKSLSIRCLNKGKYNKVDYDFLYQKDMIYIFDPNNLMKNIINRLNQNDFVFIKKLASNFSKFRECTTTAPEVARLAEASIYQGTRHSALNEIDLNGDMMLARMLKLLIYKHEEKSNGLIVYKNEVNYRNLHSIIAFMNHYDKKYTSIEKIIKHEGNDAQNQLPVSKKRTRNKKTELEGQLDFLQYMK